MSSSSPSFHCSRLPLYLLIAASISAAPIPQLVNANAFAAQGGITYRLGDAVPTNLPIPPAVFSVVSALPIASALPSRTAPLTLPNVPTPTKIVGPASPISTPSVVQKTVVVVATITVAPSLPTPAPTGAAAASGSTWSLASNFGSDLPNELGVLTWEWGQKNVVVLPGVPAAAWATQTAMPVTVAPPAPLPTASPVLQLNASTVVPAPILVPAVHAVMAAPRQFDLTNSTVMQVLFPNGSINPANKNAPVGGTGMYMTPIDLTEANNVTFEYSVFFPAGFDFVKGGKLPGMYGGHTGCSGGQQSEDCFSTRIMFRTGGMGELYLYIPKDSQPPALCQTPPLSYCDTPYGLSIGRGAWTFKTGEWTNIRQDIRLNTPGVADGGFEIHINGALMLQSNAVMFRKDMSIPDTPAPVAAPASAAQRPGLIGGLLGGILKDTTNSTAARRDSLPLLPATRPRVDSPPLPVTGSPTKTTFPIASFRPVPLRTGAATSTPLTASTAASSSVPIPTTVATPLAPVAPVATAAIGALSGLLGAAGGVLGQMGAALHASPHRRSLQLSPSPSPKPKSKSKSKGSSMVAKAKLVTFSGTMWDTFFGGNSVSYASPRDQYVYFNRVALRVNA